MRIFSFDPDALVDALRDSYQATNAISRTVFCDNMHDLVYELKFVLGHIDHNHIFIVIVEVERDLILLYSVVHNISLVLLKIIVHSEP